MSAAEFSNLLVTNSEFLKPFAITLTRDPESAKDLFQETLYRALANKEKYNGGTNIRAWLFTIMRNIFINHYRRKVKHQVVAYTSPEQLKESMPAANTTESYLNGKEILQSVHKLPDIFRYPFLLYFDGFRYHEISDMLREPLGTIKSRIHFARKLLKSEIDRY